MTNPKADAKTIEVIYRNWRGEVAKRRIVPISVWFGSTSWHPTEQWLMRAMDVAKGEIRDFALKDMQMCEANSAPFEGEENEIAGGKGERDYFEEAAFLHVYGQFTNHHPALLRGNRRALLKLKATIEEALADGAGVADVSAGDGEGYGCEVVCVKTMAGLGDPDYALSAEINALQRAAEEHRDRRRVAASD